MGRRGLRCGFYCGRGLLWGGGNGGGRSFHGLWRVLDNRFAFGGFAFQGFAVCFCNCRVRAFMRCFACVCGNGRGNGGKRSGEC